MPSRGEKELIKDGSVVSTKSRTLELMSVTLVGKETNYVRLKEKHNIFVSDAVS